jgi:hypothetical protein
VTSRNTPASARPYRPDPPPTRIERNPEAINPIKRAHVRVLERMLAHKLGMYAIGAQNDFMKAEIGALHAAIAELNEIIDAREAKDD